MTRGLLGAAALLLALPPLAPAHYWVRYYPAPVVVSSYPVALPVAVPVYAPPPVVLYEPAPVYVAPAAPGCAPALPAVPLPQTAPPPLAVPPYAPPAAAPPSDEPAPLPPSRPAPAVPAAPPGEAPSSTLMTSAARVTDAPFYDVYAVAPRAGAPPAGDRRPVSFWNLTGRDVALTVAGRTQTVPRGGRARLELGPQFVWQVAGRESRREQVADGAAGLEIVLRR